MKTRRVKLELRSVARDYRPAYPARLTPEEYRDLLADALDARIRRAAGAAALVFAAPAAAAKQPESLRQERVIALIREVHARDKSGWYVAASFRRQASREGCGEPTIVPSIPIMFGNSMNGIYDAARARALALRVFAAYGLTPKTDIALSAGGGRAVIDGLDAASKIGFEMRAASRQPESQPAEARAEPAERRLDPPEYEALNAQGYRLHVADAGGYPIMDGDRFTPALAYLAGLVDFLNSVTDGEDVDLSAILFARSQGFAVPDPRELALPSEAKVEDSSDVLWTVTLPQAMTLRFQIDPCVAPATGERTSFGQRKWTALPHPWPTLGTPTVVTFERAYFPPEGQARCRLLQSRADGAPELALEAATPTFFTAEFDATRPFAIELVLPAGASVISKHLVVGAVPE